MRTISWVLWAIIMHYSLLLQDYVFTEGDLVFQPGETRKEVQVSLLELTEIDTLLHNRQVKQFAIDLLHPKHGAKIGRYPQATVTIADPGRGWQPGAGQWQQEVVDPPPQDQSTWSVPRSSSLPPPRKSCDEEHPAPTGRCGSPSRGISGYRWEEDKWSILQEEIERILPSFSLGIRIKSCKNRGRGGQHYIRSARAEDFQLQEAKFFQGCGKKQVVQDIGGSQPGFVPACCVVLGDGITKWPQSPFSMMGIYPSVMLNGQAVSGRCPFPLFPSPWRTGTEVFSPPCVHRGGGWCPPADWHGPAHPVSQRPPERTP